MELDLTVDAGPVSVAAFYRFADIGDPHALASQLRDFGADNGLRGSIIVAREGVNGTISGTGEAVDALFALLGQHAGLEDIRPRRHDAEQRPFARWKVKVKREIVTLGVDGVDPRRDVGTYVPPSDWNALISEPDVILIDTRNDYEVAIGTFSGAVDPKTASFAEFPEWFDAQAAQWREEGRSPRIAMFCTGGIRCEKSTAFVRQRGFDDVYHLQGGILAYLAEIEAANSLWQGECFVFDDRISLTHGEALGQSSICDECGLPIPAGGEQAHVCRFLPQKKAP